MSLGQREVRRRILFSGRLGGSVHLGACLVPFKRHRPWQQRELSAYLTVKACEKRRKESDRRREERGFGWEAVDGLKRVEQHWKSLGVYCEWSWACVLFFNRLVYLARCDIGGLHAA